MPITCHLPILLALLLLACGRPAKLKTEPGDRPRVSTPTPPPQTASVADAARAAPAALSPATAQALAWLPVRAGGAVLQPPLVPDGEARLGHVPAELTAAAMDDVTCAPEHGEVARICRQPLRTSSLPRDWAALVGEPLQLYDGITPTCLARIESLAIESAATGEDAQTGGEDRLRGWVEPEFFDPALTAERRLVLRLVAASGAPRRDEEPYPCRATWARSTRLPAPVLAQVVERGGGEAARGAGIEALASEASRRYQALPEWRRIQRESRKARAQEDAPLWDHHRVVYAIPWQQGTWVVVQSTGGGPCVDWWDELRAIWWVPALPDAVAATRVWEFRGTATPDLWTADEPAPILGGVDTDGDGQLELLTPRGRIRGRCEKLDGDGVTWLSHHC